MRTLLLIAISVVFTGCSQTPPYQLTYTSQQIKSLQVLDAEAAINNDGITRELQGDYGKHAAENYRDSIYVGKEGRDVKEQGESGNN